MRVRLLFDQEPTSMALHLDFGALSLVILPS